MVIIQRRAMATVSPIFPNEPSGPKLQTEFPGPKMKAAKVSGSDRPCLTSDRKP